MRSVGDNYLVTALHQAKIKELEDRYLERGFEVKENGATANYFDLLLRHKTSGQVITFQVKLAPIQDSDLTKIEQAKDKSASLGYDFRLVTIVRPPTSEIEISWLQDIFSNYLLDNVPDEISEKATHIFIEDVELFIVSIYIIDDKADVLVEGSINVELQYGSDSDQRNDMGMKIEEVFPFTAKITLALSEKSIVDAEIDVNDSLFYY